MTPQRTRLLSVTNRSNEYDENDGDDSSDSDDEDDNEDDDSSNESESLIFQQDTSITVSNEVQYMPVHNEETNDGFRTPESVHSTIQTDSRIFPEINTSSSIMKPNVLDLTLLFLNINQIQIQQLQGVFGHLLWLVIQDINVFRKMFLFQLVVLVNFTSTSNPFNGQSTAPWKEHVSSISRDVIQDMKHTRECLKVFKSWTRIFTTSRKR